jgi:hypothetical protein
MRPINVMFLLAITFFSGLLAGVLLATRDMGPRPAEAQSIYVKQMPGGVTCFTNGGSISCVK